MTLGRYNTTAPAPTNGQSVGIQIDDAGSAFVTMADVASGKGQATTIASTVTATTVVTAQSCQPCLRISQLSYHRNSGRRNSYRFHCYTF